MDASCLEKRQLAHLNVQSGWLWAWAVTRPHKQVAASFTALLGPSGAAAELQQMQLAVSSS